MGNATVPGESRWIVRKRLGLRCDAGSSRSPSSVRSRSRATVPACRYSAHRTIGTAAALVPLRDPL